MSRLLGRCLHLVSHALPDVFGAAVPLGHGTVRLSDGGVWLVEHGSFGLVQQLVGPHLRTNYVLKLIQDPPYPDTKDEPVAFVRLGFHS